MPLVDVTDGGLDTLAADGTIVRIRPVNSDDREALRQLYRSASPESLYRRFFTASRSSVDGEVARLLRPAGPAFVARLAEQDGAVIGVGSVERLDDPHVGEFAVLVSDRFHGRGVGTLLLEHLCAGARHLGISELMGEVLPENVAMTRVASDLGRGTELSYMDGTVVVRLSTRPDDTTALDGRDRQAVRQSLTPLMAPTSVAVIGAGRAGGGIGHTVLTNLAAGGFTGALFPVNPHAESVAGIPAYPSIAAIGRPVDLAVIAVPAAGVAAVIEECGRHGVRAAVVLSSGFGETGPAGAAAQAELVRTARRHHVRLVGPNCLGVINTDPDIRLHATFASLEPPAGGLAVASQSGAVAIAILDHATRSGVGLSSFVSLGNKADVSGNDLLAYWYDDPATTAVALYLESIGNPRRFARVARALSRRKPVLVVKSGRSVTGRRAGASHTAAAAAPDATVDALFAQAGVIRCESLGDLFDVARLVTTQPRPAGGRIGVVGNAGGVNVLIADAADRHQLTVPALPERLTADLAHRLPGAATVANPIDLGAAASPDGFATAIGVVAGSGAVDAVIAVFAVTGANDIHGVLTALADAADRSPVPVAVVLLGVPASPNTLGQRHAPVYDYPEQAVSALGRTAAYARWRATPPGRLPDLSDVDTDGARCIVDAALGASPGWQPTDVTQSILACYGIPHTATATASTAEEAVRLAATFTYPVVLKAADPTLVHKSDRGGVRLNLRDADAVRAAYQLIATGIGHDQPTVVVQPMLDPGLELIAGVVHDPTFGSVVTLGLGGIHTDILGDRTLRLLPVTDHDATVMWRSLRASALLTGYRGQPGIHIAALENLLVRLGRLAEELPEVAELDINPVLATPEGVVAVDVKLRLAAVAAEPDPAVRALREPGGAP